MHTEKLFRNTKKICSVFFLTGIAHLASILTMGVCLRKLNDNDIAAIALFESFVLIATSLVTLGIQTYAAREIVKAQENWQAVYSEIQGFRSLISLLIVFAGFYLYEPGLEKYIAFFLAPVIALNGDYALYALGKPVQASVCSFIRVTLPVILLFILVYFFTEYFSLWIVFVFYMSSIFCSSFLVAKMLGAPLFTFPNLLTFRQLQLIGFIAVATFVYSNFRSGFLIYVEPFVNVDELQYIYAFIRIYLVFFAIRRTLVQIFYRKLDNNTNILQLNFVIIAIIGGALILFLSFYGIISEFLFKDKAILLVGLQWDIAKAVFASACFNVFLTKLSLMRKDKEYIVSIIFPICVFTVMIFFFTEQFEHAKNIIYYFTMTEFSMGLISFLFYCKQFSIKKDNYQDNHNRKMSS